jgi:putative endonuclease
VVAHSFVPVRAEPVEALPFLLEPLTMTFWTYMLHCNAGRFYVGHTDDLEQRVAQHETGALPGFTRDYLPVHLVWCEAFPTREEALSAERRIKGWSRAKKLALIRGDWAEISHLAKGRPGVRQAQAERSDDKAHLPVRAEPAEALPFHLPHPEHTK